MRGTPAALPLAVNSRIACLVKKESKKTKISSSYKKRLLIIDDGIEGKSKYSTSKELRISYRMINLWRDRWSESIQELKKESQDDNRSRSLKDYEILKMIKEILTDRPRSGTLKRITLAAEELLVALACDKPKNHGIQMTRWTHQMLAMVAMAQGIVDQISARHVGNILKKKVKTP